MKIKGIALTLDGTKKNILKVTQNSYLKILAQLNPT